MLQLIETLYSDHDFLSCNKSIAGHGIVKYFHLHHSFVNCLCYIYMYILHERNLIRNLPSVAFIIYSTIPPVQVFPGSFVMEYSGHLPISFTAVMLLNSYPPIMKLLVFDMISGIASLMIYTSILLLRLRDTVRAWFSYQLQPPVATVPLHSPS